jgi:hypothetical protein
MDLRMEGLSGDVRQVVAILCAAGTLVNDAAGAWEMLQMHRAAHNRVIGSDSL